MSDPVGLIVATVLLGGMAVGSLFTGLVALRWWVRDLRRRREAAERQAEPDWGIN